MRVVELLCETDDPLGTMLGQKGLAPMPTGPSELDQAKLDQIIARLSTEEPTPPATPTAAPVVAPTAKPATKGQGASIKSVAKPKQYVPVTNSPFELALRNAALKAKIAGNELAAFLGQCAHESAKFTTTKEFSDGSKYEGRKDLGNVNPGDGPRYKGRGFIQITGRANYTQASKDLGIDLVNHPELAERPDVATKVSLWYWKTRVQPKISNFNNTKAVTKKVNGGLRGLDKREKYTQSFKLASK